MRYYAIRLKQKRKDEFYRMYVTDALYALTNGGQRLARRYIDVVNPDRNHVEETRSSEEIISAIKSKLERMAEK